MNRRAPHRTDVHPLARMMPDEQCDKKDGQSWASDWCPQMANEMHQGRAGCTTAACSQIKLNVSHIHFEVSHLNAIFSGFDRETT